mmetsp:Transcript_7861/g.33076  ORF Transcript_7861/g.33076 Transcript_7861/m.33076 type:complete len:283 (+) Transcript_7861:207-1055(+)
MVVVALLNLNAELVTLEVGVEPVGNVEVLREGVFRNVGEMAVTLEGSSLVELALALGSDEEERNPVERVGSAVHQRSQGAEDAHLALAAEDLAGKRLDIATDIAIAAEVGVLVVQRRDLVPNLRGVEAPLQGGEGEAREAVELRLLAEAERDVAHPRLCRSKPALLVVHQRITWLVVVVAAVDGQLEALVVARNVVDEVNVGNGDLEGNLVNDGQVAGVLEVSGVVVGLQRSGETVVHLGGEEDSEHNQEHHSDHQPDSEECAEEIILVVVNQVKHAHEGAE